MTTTCKLFPVAILGLLVLALLAIGLPKITLAIGGMDSGHQPAVVIKKVGSKAPLSPGYHGLEKHGTGAQKVLDCLDRKGTYRIYHDDAGRKELHTCILPGDGRIGVQVLNEKGQRITEFVNRNTLKTWDDFERYLQNCGDEPGPLH